MIVIEHESVRAKELACDIASEATAVRTLKRIAAIIARDADWYWRWGDGDGGYVIDLIQQAVYRAHPGYAAIHKTTRVQPKKKPIPRWLRTKVFERDQYRCLSCGTHIDLTCDHHHPESAGGQTTIENLRTLCRPCNSRKGTAIPESEIGG